MAGPIAVLLSDSDEAYVSPLKFFREAAEQEVAVYNLEGDINKASGLMTEILGRKPALIFALGAKAAYFAKVATKDRQDIPVLFAMVLNWQRYQLLEGQDNIAGIATDVEPGSQFAYLTMFAPAVKRIGVIYSEEHSATTMNRARKAAALLGLELVAAPISAANDFRPAFNKMAESIDGFWILTDPVTFSMENMHWVQRQCSQKQIVCLGQSSNITSLGVLLSVAPDTTNLGTQAANISGSIIAGKQSPKNIGVMPPLGTILSVNIKTAREIGLAIRAGALDMANVIIE